MAKIILSLRIVELTVILVLLSTLPLFGRRVVFFLRIWNLGDNIKVHLILMLVRILLVGSDDVKVSVFSEWRFHGTW